jgi:hypothetical protein
VVTRPAPMPLRTATATVTDEDVIGVERSTNRETIAR